MTLPRSPKTIVFLRHGQTDWNLQRRLQGHTETDLNETGINQARALGAQARSNLRPGTPVYISPMRRARRTFEILRESIADPGDIAYDDRLKELSYGGWEGSTWDDIETRFPKEAARWLDDPWSESPHGGENYTDLYLRVSNLLEDFPDCAAVVSHAGVFQVMSFALGLVSRELAPLLSPPQGRVVILDGGRRG